MSISFSNRPTIQSNYPLYQYNKKHKCNFTENNNLYVSVTNKTFKDIKIYYWLIFFLTKHLLNILMSSQIRIKIRINIDLNYQHCIAVGAKSVFFF